MIISSLRISALIFIKADGGRKSICKCPGCEDIEAVIRSVKGIGEVRIGKIMEAINEKFDENAGSKETE